MVSNIAMIGMSIARLDDVSLLCNSHCILTLATRYVLYFRYHLLISKSTCNAALQADTL